MGNAKSSAHNHATCVMIHEILGEKGRKKSNLLAFNSDYQINYHRLLKLLGIMHLEKPFKIITKSSRFLKHENNKTINDRKHNC